MSDILASSAMIENQKTLVAYLKTQSTTGVPSLSTNAGFKGTTGTLTGWPLLTSKDWCTIPISGDQQVVTDAWKCWVSPNIEARTNGFKVCNTDGSYWRCDASCTWTVPAGVTSVQFQIWGPGGSNSGQCCCGGAPFGPSGAYMLAKMNVTAGAVYTLCAGCSYCCYANETTPGLGNSPSYITGPGISICAMGARSCATCWAKEVGSTATANNTQYPAQDGCAPSQCSGWNFCWDVGGDNNYVPHAFSGEANWCVKCGDTNSNQQYWGVQGLWPAMSLSTSLEAGFCSVSTPVVGFEKCVTEFMYPNGNSCQGGGYGGCYYGAPAGYLRIPGAGGSALAMSGGGASVGGDAGRFGMVCVSWN
jgi:hypothetical protein